MIQKKHEDLAQALQEARRSGVWCEYAWRGYRSQENGVYTVCMDIEPRMGGWVEGV